MPYSNSIIPSTSISSLGLPVTSQMGQAVSLFGESLANSDGLMGLKQLCWSFFERFLGICVSAMLLFMFGFLNEGLKKYSLTVALVHKPSWMWDRREIKPVNSESYSLTKFSECLPRFCRDPSMLRNALLNKSPSRITCFFIFPLYQEFFGLISYERTYTLSPKC